MAAAEANMEEQWLNYRQPSVPKEVKPIGFRYVLQNFTLIIFYLNGTITIRSDPTTTISKAT